MAIWNCPVSVDTWIVLVPTFVFLDSSIHQSATQRGLTQSDPNWRSCPDCVEQAVDLRARQPKHRLDSVRLEPHYQGVAACTPFHSGISSSLLSGVQCTSISSG